MTDAFASDVETWIDPNGHDLSARIWINRAALREHIDTMLTEAIQRGDTVAQVSERLLRYVKPSYAPYGDGKARYAANRLASHEMRRASAIGTQQVAMTNPAGGYLRYQTSSGHSELDECDDRANHDEGFGRGVYRAQDCPLPPEHIGCRCSVGPPPAGIGQYGDMDAFVEQLRVEYDLADPPDLSPDELAEFRRETAQIREDVQVLFRGWFEQTGQVSRESLMEASPTVRDWVESVQAEKRRRR